MTVNLSKEFDGLRLVGKASKKYLSTSPCLQVEKQVARNLMKQFDECSAPFVKKKAGPTSSQNKKILSSRPTSKLNRSKSSLNIDLFTVLKNSSLVFT